MPNIMSESQLMEVAAIVGKTNSADFNSGVCVIADQEGDILSIGVGKKHFTKKVELLNHIYPEINALFKLKSHIQFMTAYSLYAPCYESLKVLKYANITKVYFYHTYHLLEESDLELKNLESLLTNNKISCRRQIDNKNLLDLVKEELNRRNDIKRKNQRWVNVSREVNIDTTTKLMWDITLEKFNLQTATKYASANTTLDYADWRIPTVQELNTLVDLTRTSPASFLEEMPNETIWSSTPLANSTIRTWIVDFSIGSVSNAHKSSIAGVVLVRDILTDSEIYNEKVEDSDSK